MAAADEGRSGHPAEESPELIDAIAEQESEEELARQADAELENRAKSRVGAVLRDKYRLDYVLGYGGAATVYAATHRNGSRVALKLLHPELALEPEVRARFLREGYVANKVKHAGAVSVIDDDVTEEGWAFLVMDLLVGMTAHALWESWSFRLPPQLVTAVTLQILDVMESAHANGIVHRDLKPDNVFLTPQGDARVLDFGIARVQDSGGRKTNVGAVLGTPAFMAPEQAASRSRDIDARTDLWAIGAIGFTLLTGDIVHPGENPGQILIAAATQPARKMGTIVPEMPQAIIAVFDKALAFDRADRWPSAGAMRDALKATAQQTWGSVPGPSAIGDALTGLVDPLREVPPYDGSAAARRSSAEIVARSQVSEVTGPPVDLAIEPEPEQPASTRRAAILGVAVASVLVALVGIFVMFGHAPASASAATPLVTDAMAAISSSAAASVAAAPATGSASSPDPAPVASGGNPAPSSAKSGATPTNSAHASHGGKAHSHCDPPYIVVGEKKIWKRDCL